MAAMAGAEPAAVFAARIGGPLARGHATQMGANANQHQPLILLHPGLVGRRIGQGIRRNGARFFDFLGRAVAHENRLAAPHHGHGLAFRDRGQIHISVGQRQRILGGLQGSDEGPSNGTNTDRGESAGHQRQKVASGRPIGRRVSVISHPQHPLAAGAPSCRGLRFAARFRFAPLECNIQNEMAAPKDRSRQETGSYSSRVCKV